MVLLMSFAFAGVNDFKTNLGSSFVPAANDRIHFLDVSDWGSGAMGKEYVSWSWLTGQMAKQSGALVSLDTSVVLAEASGSGTYSISIKSDQFLLLDWLYVESGADASDYFALTTADSNGTDLDTLNLINSGRRTNTYFFNPTQDTTLYIVRGDTMSVDKKVVIRKMVFDK